ncbi:MAG: hypothetical protein U1E72_04345 [Burkholderiaceae bacterium]
MVAKLHLLLERHLVGHADHAVDRRVLQAAVDQDEPLLYALQS